MNAYIKSLPLPIAIVGMGKSGTATRKLLLKSGIPESQVFTFDEKAVSDFSTEAEVLRAEPKTLVVSPGVSLQKKWIQELRDDGCLITSEINLAASFLTTEVVVGITGSIGKSTTTAALGFALTSVDPYCFFGGNLGTPFAEYALASLEPDFKKAGFVVLELSSYQLENSSVLQLDYGIITFLSPNHLERYEDLDEYYQTKWKIFSQTKRKVFGNYFGGDLVDWSIKKPQSNFKIIHCENDFPDEDWSQYQVLGKHNQQNLALCLTVLKELSVLENAKPALLSFKGLSHRMENLGTKAGILFVNDSKATSLDSVRTAADSCLDHLSGTLWLLLGGKDKGLPWESLRDLSQKPQIKFVLFGDVRMKIQKRANLQGPAFSGIKDALDFVRSHAVKGDTVLLSPGGTSLDEFPNFEARGDFFKNYVQQNFI